VEQGIVSPRRHARGRQIGAEACAEDAGDGVKTLDATEGPEVAPTFGAANDVPPERRYVRAAGGRYLSDERRDESAEVRGVMPGGSESKGVHP